MGNQAKGYLCVAAGCLVFAVACHALALALGG
jgi:hypothetical protein